MSVQLQDRYNDPMMSMSLATIGDEFGASPYADTFMPLSSGLDSISRLLNPQGSSYQTDAESGSGMMSIVQQLFSVISQLMGNLGGSSLGGSNGFGGDQQYFTSAGGGSNGDPHLSFNGSTWNDMQSEGNLLDSNSLPSGYRLSTQTTQPNANGITYNQQATVTTDYGNTQVTLDKNGNATYTQWGTTNSIAPGQTIQLGNGETVTRAQSGSLTITNATPAGGQITTTMSENGNGVDVNVSANNVDLGGALVSGANGTPSSTPQPIDRPTPRRLD